MSSHRPFMTDPRPYFNRSISDGQSYVTLLISIWDRRWSNTNVEEDVKYVSYYVLDSQSNQFNKEFIHITFQLPVSLPVHSYFRSNILRIMGLSYNPTVRLTRKVYF